jgi:hypothetical protein
MEHEHVINVRIGGENILESLGYQHQISQTGILPNHENPPDPRGIDILRFDLPGSKKPPEHGPDRTLTMILQTLGGSHVYFTLPTTPGDMADSIRPSFS